MLREEQFDVFQECNSRFSLLFLTFTLRPLTLKENNFCLKLFSDEKPMIGSLI